MEWARRGWFCYRFKGQHSATQNGAPAAEQIEPAEQIVLSEGLSTTSSLVDVGDLRREQRTPLDEEGSKRPITQMNKHNKLGDALVGAATGLLSGFGFGKKNVRLVAQAPPP